MNISAIPKVFAFVSSLVLVGVMSTARADDGFLFLNGILGGSKAAQYVGSIEVSEFSFASHGQSSYVAGGGTGSSKSILAPIKVRIMSSSGMAFPSLWLTMNRGAYIASGSYVHAAVGGGGALVELERYDFTNIRILSLVKAVSSSNQGEDIIVTFVPDQIALTYVPTSTRVTWNYLTNTP